MIVLVYALFEIIKMVSLNDYKIQLREEENEYEATERFGEEEGFALAAGVVSTNSDDWDDEAGRYLHKEIPPEIGHEH